MKTTKSKPMAKVAPVKESEVIDLASRVNASCGWQALFEHFDIDCRSVAGVHELRCSCCPTARTIRFANGSGCWRWSCSGCTAHTKGNSFVELIQLLAPKKYTVNQVFNRALLLVEGVERIKNFEQVKRAAHLRDNYGCYAIH